MDKNKVNLKNNTQNINLNENLEIRKFNNLKDYLGHKTKQSSSLNNNKTTLNLKNNYNLTETKNLSLNFNTNENLEIKNFNSLKDYLGAETKQNYYLNNKATLNENPSPNEKFENLNTYKKNDTLNVNENISLNPNLNENLETKNFNSLKDYLKHKTKQNFSLNINENLNPNQSFDNLNLTTYRKNDTLNINENISLNLNENLEIKNFNSLKDYLGHKTKQSSSLNDNNKNSVNLKFNEKEVQDSSSKKSNFKDKKSVDYKKSKLEEKKINIEKKIRKNYTLKFREIEEVPTENGTEIKSKFKPRLEVKGFQEKDSSVRKVYYKINDSFKNHLHNKVYENENDNDTLKTLHNIERNVENQLTYFNRTSNYRKLKKYYALNKKINTLDYKQNINNLKSEYNLNFGIRKKFKTSNSKNKNQKQKNKKKILYKIRLNKLKKSIQARMYLNKIQDKIFFNIFSFKMLVPLIILFSIILFIAIFFTLSNVFSNSNSLYDLQKAELYYRELEANLEYEKGISINHNPVDLASFLLARYGEFEFNEDTKDFLDTIFSFQYEEDLSLKDLIRKNLSESEYEYFLFLYETKCGFIRYGSPFDFDYEKYISSYVGYRIDPTSENKVLKFHKGLDIAVGNGTEILAIADGTVINATYSESYGNVVSIYHDDGYISKYAHCESLNVKNGQKVSQGQVIAYVGSTGDSTGNHLHLEILDETGTYMNPIYLIERWSEIE